VVFTDAGETTSSGRYDDEHDERKRQRAARSLPKTGRRIYYKDWGKGPIVTFSHGSPLNSDAWDGQMLFLAQNGFRVIAHDRRGHGRSSQPSSGNEMNTYADDLAKATHADRVNVDLLAFIRS
jgi:non-heme chloroperoxidase